MVALVIGTNGDEGACALLVVAAVTVPTERGVAAVCVATPPGPWPVRSG